MKITVTDEGFLRKIVVVHITDTVNGNEIDLTVRGTKREETIKEALRVHESAVENLCK